MMKESGKPARRLRRQDYVDFYIWLSCSGAFEDGVSATACGRLRAAAFLLLYAFSNTRAVEAAAVSFLSASVFLRAPAAG